jgi:hypothetical protein
VVRTRPAHKEGWFVVLGSWPKAESRKADERLALLKQKGVGEVRIVDTNDYPKFGKDLLAVVAGPFSKAEARRTVSSLKAIIGDAFIKSAD